MSRKDYQRIAAILAGEYALASHGSDDVVREATVRVVTNTMYSVADVFAQDNPRFDRQRFYDAVMGE